MDFTEIWNKLVVETNLFNFIIMVCILALVFWKMDLKSMLNSMQEKVSQTIDEVKQNQAKSEEKLAKAKEEVKNLPADIEKINSDAKESAEMISAKIVDDAKKQAEHISQNADKVILAEEKQIISNLIKLVSVSSVEKSRENTVNMLKDNIEMHEKYISESIEKLDGLTL